MAPFIGTILSMRRRHHSTLEMIFNRPTSGGIKWSDILALFRELGAEMTEHEGSRVGVRLFGERRVFHRPHPSPDTDKGCVESVRKWFEQHGVKP
jgi:HicA toxin of bacterial toxin-antitoxin,